MVPFSPKGFSLTKYDIRCLHPLYEQKGPHNTKASQHKCSLVDLLAIHVVSKVLGQWPGVADALDT